MTLDFALLDTMSRWSQMKINSHSRPSEPGMQASVVLLLISMLIWGTMGVAQTSDNGQDLTLDTPGNETDTTITVIDAVISDPQNPTDGPEEKLPDGEDADRRIPEAETPPAGPEQAQAPSRRSGGATSAIERFTPTEEISADNAVPFPVDI